MELESRGVSGRMMLEAEVRVGERTYTSFSSSRLLRFWISRMVFILATGNVRGWFSFGGL